MRLFIAEKPSLARAIAAGLGISQKREGCIVGGSDVVTWCFGHILEQYTPEDYDAKFKKWAIEDLPILPTEWKLKVSKDAETQYKIISQLVQKADVIVNAGDPDREGQLLVDEVLNQLGVLRKTNIKRILLNALDEKSVKTALGDLRDNQDFVGLRNSALARSRADWLIGMNLTRMYTIRANQVGYSGVVSVGRVQTPTLALIVRRELAIRNFKPVDYYILRVSCQHENGIFFAQWKPNPDCMEMDEEHRILDKSIIEGVIQRLDGTIGKIESVEQKRGQSLPRLPYSLSSLQIDAGKLFGYSPKEVLDAQQSLYERKLTTYPRSDCDYLPTNQLADVPQIFGQLKILSEEFAEYVALADASARSRAWNDEKISAHHAIIPTTERVNIDELSETERNLYLLIAKAYLAQFYPPQTFLTTQIDVTYGGEHFHASGKTILDDGWKKLYAGGEEEKSDQEDHEEEQKLPVVEKGDTVIARAMEIVSRTTKPPKRFNPSTLLKAMKEIGKYVKDDSLKPILKDCSGIGTEATRASIIEMLQTRGFVSMQKKFLVPTEKGLLMLKILSDNITYPDITARWEHSLDRISCKEISLKDFFAEQREFVRHLLKDGKEKPIPPSKTAIYCPKCGAIMQRRYTMRNGKKSYFWGCSNYPKCKEIVSDNNQELGVPISKKKKKPKENFIYTPKF